MYINLVQAERVDTLAMAAAVEVFIAVVAVIFLTLVAQDLAVEQVVAAAVLTLL